MPEKEESSWTLVLFLSPPNDGRHGPWHQNVDLLVDKRKGGKARAQRDSARHFEKHCDGTVEKSARSLQSRRQHKQNKSKRYLYRSINETSFHIWAKQTAIRLPRATSLPKQSEHAR